MSAAEDVAQHIYGSLLDLRRRLDAEVALEVARAVVDGASRAVEELSEAARSEAAGRAGHDPGDFSGAGSSKH